MNDYLERQTYDVEEVAQLLGISRGACYQAVAKGEIPSIRIGGRLLVPRTALEKLLSTTLTAPSE